MSKAYDHMGRVKELPCGLCGQGGPSSAHHILEGRIPGRKSPDWLVIPLCYDCHQGAINGIHGQRRMWIATKSNELDILAQTLETLYGTRA